MHLRLQLRLPLIVLTIADLCLGVTNFSDTNTIDQNNIDVSRSLNKYHKFNSNRQSNVIDTSDDDIPKFNDEGDRQSSNTIRRNDVESAESSMSFDSSEEDDDDNDYDDVSDNQPLNFLITNFLSDGEIERRIHFNGITAKETLVVNSG